MNKCNKVKELFGIRTVRKKVFFLSKAAGGAIVFFYILVEELPVSSAAASVIWFFQMLCTILGVNYLLGRYITNPIDLLNKTAGRMAKLDFSQACTIESDDEFGELSVSLNTLASNLQQSLSQLESVNAQLEKDVDQKQKLLAQRKELTDHLSHEMKTPLGVIRAYAEGLQDETDPEKQKKYTQVIVSETELMNRMIISLLDLSALEAGAVKLLPERFDFIEFTETVGGRLLMDIPDDDFQLEYELPGQKVYVNADKGRMEQVLDNLIVNGKKNVIPGGIIRISVHVADSKLYFSIYNQGRTIPEEQLSKIWTKFYKSNRANHNGSGLGLAIVAQILAMQDMDYGVNNCTDGVEFYFAMPIME